MTTTAKRQTARREGVLKLHYLMILRAHYTPIRDFCSLGIGYDCSIKTKELVLLMPPHATPKAVDSLAAARQARDELRASEKTFAAMAKQRPGEYRETLSSLRAELEKVERYIGSV